MFLTKLKRILRSGFVNFWRNGFVTVAAILVMTVTLFVMGSLIFVDAMLDSSLAQIEEKVDVNVYFTLDASEEEIQSVKAKVEGIPEVAFVEYISQEQALENFKELRLAEGDETSLQALEELEDNPLPARLNVRAAETDQYETIATFVESDRALPGSGRDVIDKVNFFQNEEAINTLSSIINSIDRLSLVTIIIFVIISILIVFNTIRLAIYTAREEIEVMQLVGASRRYIRGPFIVEGVMYGVVSALIALVLFYPVTLSIGPFTELFFGSTNAFDYYVDNFAQMFLILMFVGAALGAVSSWLATKKYLRL
ncbi:MAG: permease-like cell division protein FtsX [Candidatus Paceibacterota bacterium]